MSTAQPPSRATIDRVTRWVAAAAIAGLVIGGGALLAAAAGLARARVLEQPGFIVGLAALLGVTLVPAARVAAVTILGQPISTLSDRDRTSAIVGGLLLVLNGVLVVSRSKTGAGIALGFGLLTLGLLVSGAAGRRPHPSLTVPTRPVLWTLLPAILLTLASMMPAFDGPGSLDRAYTAAMKSDLRTLMDWQDDHFRRTGRYASRTDSSYHRSIGVKPLELVLTADGYAATVRHERTPVVCALFVGSSPVRPATFEAEPGCTPFPPRDDLTFGWLWLATFVVLAGAAVAIEGRSAPSTG